MFSGIVEELGRFVGQQGDRFRFSAHTVLSDAAIGDSISTNGCCLTAVAIGDGWWEADVSPETLARTSLGVLRPGDPVNLERSMRLEDRLGGHLVQGHVDAVGSVVDPVPDLRIRLPAELLRYCVEKGSLAVDGVSLTIVELFDDGVSFAIIPHTAEVTTLGSAKPGDPVNVEVDVMAKHIERLLEAHLPNR